MIEPQASPGAYKATEEKLPRNADNRHERGGPENRCAVVVMRG